MRRLLVAQASCLHSGQWKMQLLCGASFQLAQSAAQIDSAWVGWNVRLFRENVMSGSPVPVPVPAISGSGSIQRQGQVTASSVGGSGRERVCGEDTVPDRRLQRRLRPWAGGFSIFVC